MFPSRPNKGNIGSSPIHCNRVNLSFNALDSIPEEKQGSMEVKTTDKKYSFSERATN